MIAPYFPSILVPIVGIFLPGIAMATLFIYIEKKVLNNYSTLSFFLLILTFIMMNLTHDPYRKTAVH